MLSKSIKNTSKDVFFFASASVLRQKFFKLGFREDIRTNRFIIYRNSNYPFQRIVLPVEGRVSTIALRYILDAIGENYDTFLQL